MPQITNNFLYFTSGGLSFTTKEREKERERERPIKQNKKPQKVVSTLLPGRSYQSYRRYEWEGHISSF
jgi:hypothetical protein